MITYQPGDLLLFRVSSSSNWLDKLIGWGQKFIHEAPTDAEYCHVTIVGPDSGSMYEARWPKIQNGPLDLSKIQKNIIIEAYRVKNITPAQVQLVMEKAKSLVGRWYDILAILTMGKVQLGSSMVCSEYAYNCFLNAGIVLSSPDALESPDDIAASPLLMKL